MKESQAQGRRYIKKQMGPIICVFMDSDVTVILKKDALNIKSQNV